MFKSPIKIAILTNVIPTYREGFYDRLFGSEEVKVKVYCQSNVPGINYKTIHHQYPDNVKLLKFVAARNEQIVLQFIPIFEILKNYDIVFIDGNPRIVSHALFATFMRILNRKVIVWSMVHSFKNNRLTENIRIFWLRCFRYHFLYNDADVLLLKERGFNDKIMIGMNNGLDQKKIDNISSSWTEASLEDWQKKMGINDKFLVISSGRIEKNKYLEMVLALPKIVEKIPNFLWCLIGDGADKANLENKVSELNLNQNIRFLGEIYEQESLAPWFLSALFFVHPTAVGLSIMHAFGYSLPIITHDVLAEHGPEFVAFENHKTGLLYQKGNFNDLANCVFEISQNRKKLFEMKANVLTIAREKYNVDVMVKRFLMIVNQVSKA